MSFVSFSFAILFLIFISLFHAASKLKKNAVLIQQVLVFLASLVFYAWADLKFVPFLAYIIVVTYFAGIVLNSDTLNFDGKGNKGRVIFFAFVAADLLPLLFFKYAPRNWHQKIIFPLGLSFITFQSLSYIIDCKTKKIQAEKNPFMTALFVSFFPVISLGPIQRPGNLIPQLKKEHKFNYEEAADGLRLFAWGAFKKFCAADALASYVNYVYARGTVSERPAPALILAIVFFSFQLYMDFSGYSDMAIGVARYMGFDIGTNFDHPYLAKSITEFWRCWHISLSTWLRDYVYFPLGGSRVPTARVYFNIIMTFLISGLWHGSTWNFVIWGLLYGVYQSIERALKSVTVKSKIPDFIKIIFTFCVVTLFAVFFRAETLPDAWNIVKGFGRLPRDIAVFISTKSQFGIKTALSNAFAIEYGFMNMFNRFVTLGIFICASVATRNKSGLEIIRSKPVAVRWAAYYALCLLIIYFFNTNLVTNFVYSNF